MSQMPRVQTVVAPILRADPRLEGVTVVTWVPDIDFREFPMLQVRRIGGTRNVNAPKLHTLPVIELTAYTTEGLIETEELYETALEVLYDAVHNQTQTDAGYLTSIFETLGATQFSSLFQDSWRIQGLIRLGVRSPRSTT
ncbi:tail terminator [Mycobacterium phage BobSwaget]|nr:tail terminator [Mycobacterium phage BobSwaget]ASW31369.1 tail terminator [Mycobacterium phage Lokk]QDF18420.1 tail terminator [Mycobacterium Phage Rachaly]QGH78719.1 tail terminator [Mycobacterium phage Miko]